MLEFVEVLTVGFALIAVYIALIPLIYVVLGLPGVAICFLIRRFLRNRYWPRAVATSVAASLLLTPVPVLGHNLFILPLPFAVWLWNYSGAGDVGIAIACIFGTAALMLLLFLSWRYFRRAATGQPIAGRLERWWRGA